MLGVAREIEANAVKRDPSLVFKTGFHAVPSMDLLHAHIVSQDFDSSWLKTKKHWNSFASEFFLSAEFVLSELTSKVS
jgi:aprataxin